MSSSNTMAQSPSAYTDTATAVDDQEDGQAATAQVDNGRSVSEAGASDISDNTTDTKPSGSYFEIVRKYASLSDVLRMTGALAVAIAMGLFLLEGVDVKNDLYRFLTMLGLTSALTAAGFLMSMVLKEQRGSRVFISLGLLSVPVNFTVFGALIYSVTPLDSMAAFYPGFAHWTATAADMSIALIGGAVVLLPVVWLGYSVLARSARSWLSAALILGSAVLIIPVRQELWAAMLALGSTVAIWSICLKNSKDSLALKTAEGKFAVALLFVAPIIIAVRSLILYEVSGVLVLTLAGGFYFYIRQLTARRVEKNIVTTSLMILAAIASVVVSVSAGDVLDHYMAGNLPMVFSAVILLLLTFDMYSFSHNKDMAGNISAVMVSIATVSLVFTALVSGSALITILSAAILLVVAVVSYLGRLPAAASIAAIGGVAIMFLNIDTLWAMIARTGWWGIAIGGAAAIVAGSMLDRAGTVVGLKR